MKILINIMIIALLTITTCNAESTRLEKSTFYNTDIKGYRWEVTMIGESVETFEDLVITEEYHRMSGEGSNFYTSFDIPTDYEPIEYKVFFVMLISHIHSPLLTEEEGILQIKNVYVKGRHSKTGEIIKIPVNNWHWTNKVNKLSTKPF